MINFIQNGNLRKEDLLDEKKKNNLWMIDKDHRAHTGHIAHHSGALSCQPQTRENKERRHWSAKWIKVSNFPQVGRDSFLLPGLVVGQGTTEAGES